MNILLSGLAHSVTQSSFATPCTYLAASGNTSEGFDSGLQTAVQFSINITDDQRTPLIKSSAIIS